MGSIPLTGMVIFSEVFKSEGNMVFHSLGGDGELDGDFLMRKLFDLVHHEYTLTHYGHLLDYFLDVLQLVSKDYLTLKVDVFFSEKRLLIIDVFACKRLFPKFINHRGTRYLKELRTELDVFVEKSPAFPNFEESLLYNVFGQD